MGWWRSLAVFKEKDTLKVPVDLVPIEYAAMLREMSVAYRLLEDYGESPTTLTPLPSPALPSPLSSFHPQRCVYLFGVSPSNLCSLFCLGIFNFIWCVCVRVRAWVRGCVGALQAT